MRVPCTCGSDVPGLHGRDCPRAIRRPLTAAIVAALIGGIALYGAAPVRPSGRITQRVEYESLRAVYEAWCDAQADAQAMAVWA